MSQTRYAQLLAAGAPELPEGFYYRIREKEIGFGIAWYEVEVRERRPGRWRLDITHGRASVDLADRPKEDPAALFAEACRFAWQRAEGVARLAARNSTARTYLGDHP